MFCLSLQAKAGKVCFGEGEELHFIAAVGLKDKEDRPLAISRKLTTSCFVFPYAQRDDGFVLTVPADKKIYYPFPSKQEVAEFQKMGTLPDPLPNWEPGLGQVIYANLLWVSIGAGVLVGLYTKYKI